MYLSEVVWYQKQVKRKEAVKRWSSLGCVFLGLFLLCGILKFALEQLCFADDTTNPVYQEVLSSEAGFVEQIVKEPVDEKANTNMSDIPEEQTGVLEESDMSNTVPCIILDAGHGGMDEGCGKNGVEEKDINLKLVLALQEKLTEKGFEVRLTREEDVAMGLAERVNFANELQGDLYISIHQNASEYAEIAGIETWYYEGDGRENQRLATLVQQYLILYTKAKDRGIIESDELYVTRECDMPSCLIETGFITNEEEVQLLSDEEYCEKLVQGLTDAIWYYFYPKKMYLTFDDGPDGENTIQILDELKSRNIKATFFVVGENVEKYPEIVKRIVEEGHTIGIHCYNHSYDVVYADVDAYIEDFEKARELVYELTGQEVWCYRFPGGSINRYNKEIHVEIAERMSALGYEYFDWNAGFEDAVSGVTEAKIILNAKESTLQRKHVIMLAHDTVEETVECLGKVLDELPEYEFLPLTAEVSPIRFK